MLTSWHTMVYDHGISWYTVRGNTTCSLLYHGITWYTMLWHYPLLTPPGDMWPVAIPHGLNIFIPWYRTMEYHGKSAVLPRGRTMVCYGIPPMVCCNTMRSYYAIPWYIMVHHDIPCTMVYLYHGITILQPRKMVVKPLYNHVVLP